MNVREKNNFDFIRFIASSLVLFSHSFSLVLTVGREPLNYFSEGRLSSGRVAVIIFFILSGFLIASSWESRNNFAKFMTARILRIFPGLFVLLVLTIIAAFFITTAAPLEYLYSSAKYFVKNITLYKGQYNIAGVFENNPFGSAINGSLWTLSHEFTCYLLIGFLGAFGILNSLVVVLILLMGVFISTSISIPSTFLTEFFPLMSWFLAGSLIYLNKERQLSGKSVSILFVLVVVFLFFKINLIYISPVLAYFLIYLTYTKSPFLNFGKYGDFSYGIYIYAFPVQQYVIYLMVKSVIAPMTWWLVFIISFPVTLIFAIASWYFIEKRFLKLKKMRLN